MKKAMRDHVRALIGVIKWPSSAVFGGVLLANGTAAASDVPARVDTAHPPPLSRRPPAPPEPAAAQTEAPALPERSTCFDQHELGQELRQAGKLLDAMLASIGLLRGRDTYIANVVKCRPPGNRTPTLDEAQACAEYLDRQIELISPKVIVALGKTAATRLLGQEASLASLRGKRHAYRGYPVIVTYHPAYLLRNLPDKAKTWEDLHFARRIFAGKD